MVKDADTTTERAERAIEAIKPKLVRRIAYNLEHGFGDVRLLFGIRDGKIDWSKCGDDESDKLNI